MIVPFKIFFSDRSISTGSTIGPYLGYGISSPGRLYQQILAMHNGKLSAAEREAAFHPTTLGFYTTLVLEGAEKDRRAKLPAAKLGERALWRDRRLMALLAHKRRAAKTIGN